MLSSLIDSISLKSSYFNSIAVIAYTFMILRQKYNKKLIPPNIWRIFSSFSVCNQVKERRQYRGQVLKWTEVNLSLWFLENKPKLLHLLWTDSLNVNMLFLNKQCVNYMGQNVCFWHYNWKNHHVFIIIFRKTKFISLFLCNFAP